MALKWDDWPPAQTGASPDGGKAKRAVVKPEALPGWARDHKCPSFDSETAGRLMGVPQDEVAEALGPVAETGALVQLTTETWTLGREDATFEVLNVADFLMRHFGVSYYVGWMSAGERYGATHYCPARLVTAVEREIPELADVPLTGFLHYGTPRWVYQTSFKPLFEPVVRANIADVPVETKWFPHHESECWTPLVVSTIEATILDCVDRPDLAGGIDNLANIACSFLEMPDEYRGKRNRKYWQSQLDPKKLAETASLYDHDVVQQCGWLLGRLRWRCLTPFRLGPLRRTLPHRLSKATFDPEMAGDRPVVLRSRRWNLDVPQVPQPDW